MKQLHIAGSGAKRVLQLRRSSAKIMSLLRNLDSLESRNVTRSKTDAWCSGARLSRSATQDCTFSPSYIYYIFLTWILWREFLWLYYDLQLYHRVSTARCYIQPVSSCSRLLHSTFCFPKTLSSSEFPLPPAEALHQFSHPSTVRCHGFLPGLTLSISFDMSCIPMYSKTSHILEV